MTYSQLYGWEPLSIKLQRRSHVYITILPFLQTVKQEKPHLEPQSQIPLRQLREYAHDTSLQFHDFVAWAACIENHVYAQCYYASAFCCCHSQASLGSYGTLYDQNQPPKTQVFDHPGEYPARPLLILTMIFSLTILHGTTTMGFRISTVPGVSGVRDKAMAISDQSQQYDQS